MKDEAKAPTRKPSTYQPTKVEREADASIPTTPDKTPAVRHRLQPAQGLQVSGAWALGYIIPLPFGKTHGTRASSTCSAIVASPCRFVGA